MIERRGLFALPAIIVMVIATVSVAPQTQGLAIIRVNVIDVANGRILPDATVAISSGTIISVTQNGAPPPNARMVDGDGQFVIPGLWDMHAHGAVTAWWLELYVANGVTGIRDMGSELADLDVILKERDAIVSGRMLGPRIFFAGPILDDAPGEWPLRLRVKTGEDGRAAVQRLKRRGGGPNQSARPHAA